MNTYPAVVERFMRELCKAVKKQKEEGFTLIELLLAMGIIAIIASIVIIAINPSANIQEAQTRVGQQQAREIQSAIVQYIIDHGSAPSGIGGDPQVLCSDGFVPADGDCEISLQDDIANSTDSEYSFISQIPQHPAFTPPNSGHQVYFDGSRYFVDPVSSSSSSVAPIACVEGGTYPITTSVNSINPQYSNGYIYTSGESSGGIRILNVETDTLSSLALAGNPVTQAIASGKLYLGNASNVNVYDISSETVTSTIAAGVGTFSISDIAMVVGTDLYLTDVGADNVVVIDTTSDAVTSTIAVGDQPRYPTLVGTDLYVSNQNAGTVSVIDTTTNTVSATVNVGTTPRNSTLVGTDLYVSNFGSDNVSVIDTTTNTVSATINVDDQPQFSALAGTKLYVSNYNDATVSVINTATNTVTSTINVGTRPAGATLVDDKLYLTHFTSGELRVIDTGTDTVSSTITFPGFGIQPHLEAPLAVDQKLYASYNAFGNGFITAINLNTDTICGS